MGLLLDLYCNFAIGRLRRDDANIRDLLARASQLLRVALADVNRLAPALFPAGNDSGPIIAVEPVMRGERLGGLSGLESPFGAAWAVAFWHT